VIADILMPKMDGYEFVRQVRADPAIAGSRVMFYTAAYLEPEARQLAAACGVTHIIVKPSEPEEVLKIITEELAAITGPSGPISAEDFDRAHRGLLTDKLHQKVAELESANAELEQRIRERDALQQQFLQVQKMEAVGQLAGGVAHDFNNLITVIMGFGEILANALPESDPRRRYVDGITKAGERAAGLTRQLLAFSRKQSLDPKTLDLNTVVAGMDAMLRRLIGENIALTASAGEELWPVKADPGQIEQVVMNLVINARDAMPDGGSLFIETRNVSGEERSSPSCVLPSGLGPGGHVMLAVTDTGIGMSEEVKARILEPFFTTKAADKGTGLGLTTCDGILKQSGGRMSVESAPGRGTTFRIFLPRLDQPVEAVGPQVRPKELPKGTETLLLVEDEEAVRNLAAHVLRLHGYDVMEAPNGQAGLRVARQLSERPIDLVITDVVMPQMGGKVMADWLREERPDLKILFTSGYTDDAIVDHGVLEPDMAFLSKPYTPDTLVRKVRAVLDDATGRSAER
jgi:signal transduction histidine kinase/ActR/RegA family two-component response regulator